MDDIVHDRICESETSARFRSNIFKLRSAIEKGFWMFSKVGNFSNEISNHFKQLKVSHFRYDIFFVRYSHNSISETLKLRAPISLMISLESECKENDFTWCDRWNLKLKRVICIFCIKTSSLRWMLSMKQNWFYYSRFKIQNHRKQIKLLKWLIIFEWILTVDAQSVALPVYGSLPLCLRPRYWKRSDSEDVLMWN